MCIEENSENQKTKICMKTSSRLKRKLLHFPSLPPKADMYKKEKASNNCDIQMGRSPYCDSSGLKKGPWTPEEDHKLLAYIQQHGHGSWRALPPKAGTLLLSF